MWQKSTTAEILTQSIQTFIILQFLYLQPISPVLSGGLNMNLNFFIHINGVLTLVRLI